MTAGLSFNLIRPAVMLIISHGSVCSRLILHNDELGQNATLHFPWTVRTKEKKGSKR